MSDNSPELAEDEASVFDEARLYEEEIDRRRQLSVSTDAAAEVVVDLQTQGALYRYVLMRRDQAKAALADLVDLDPKDATAIAIAQVRVKEYIAACSWIDNTLARGAEADQMIEEEFGAQALEPLPQE